MAIVVEYEVEIASEQQTVWGLLVHLSGWKTWWPECLEAMTRDHHSTLREGSNLEILLETAGRKRTYLAEVDMLSEGKTLSMTHRSWALQGTVIWTLRPGREGIRVSVRGAFKGLGPFWEHTMGRDHRFEVPLRAQLRALKRIAEQMI